jgi:hypothetical protein
MNPSPTAITAIQTFVASSISGGWSNGDAEILAALNAPSIANAAAAAQVPVPYGWATLQSNLSAASKGNLLANPNFDTMLTDVNANNTANVVGWIDVISTATPALVTSAEATSMLAVVNATQPDPNFQPLLPWAIVNLFRLADAGDVSSARPA